MNEIIKKIRKCLSNNKCTDQELYKLLQNVEDKLDLAEKIEKCLYDTELYMVYKHTDPVGKVYIGITQNHPQTRWNEGGGYEKQSKFYKAIQKYGWIHFKHEILSAGLSKEEALKLENELIIRYRAYEEEFGYNTMVDLKEVIQENVIQSRGGKKTKTNKKDIVDIVKELIEKYSIKTIDSKIYYLKNEEYVLERVYPLLEKELIVNYNISTKFHKEIIKQIEIVSYVSVDSLNDIERKMIINDNNDGIPRWMKSNNLTREELLTLPTVTLYTEYKKWCAVVKERNVLGKKQFFKIIEEMFGLEKKQKADGKRYFCNSVGKL